MQQKFFKYQGTGNDFVLIDNREESFPSSKHHLIEKLCDRRFGIGADGLILLQNHAEFDFEMVYFNSDGKPSSMCGNGGRCIIAFAHFLGIIGNECKFLAIDGEHLGKIDKGSVSLQMIDVASIEKVSDHQYFLDTGSPHIVAFSEHPTQEIALIDEAHKIRYNERFASEGTNVNFACNQPNFIDVRTYERGVENETFSCGTGVTAVALAAHFSLQQPNSTISIKTKGGELAVSFEEVENGSYRNIWLHGPAQHVFEGTVSLDF